MFLLHRPLATLIAALPAAHAAHKVNSPALADDVPAAVALRGAAGLETAADNSWAPAKDYVNNDCDKCHTCLFESDDGAANYCQGFSRDACPRQGGRWCPGGAPPTRRPTPPPVPTHSPTPRPTQSCATCAASGRYCLFEARDTTQTFCMTYDDEDSCVNSGWGGYVTTWCGDGPVVGKGAIIDADIASE